jgi:alkylation response protein AidB-like acyl-CoA dehydrogenase
LIRPNARRTNHIHVCIDSMLLRRIYGGTTEIMKEIVGRSLGV